MNEIPEKAVICKRCAGTDSDEDPSMWPILAILSSGRFGTQALGLAVAMNPVPSGAA
jgi:hypothetical protein